MCGKAIALAGLLILLGSVCAPAQTPALFLASKSREYDRRFNSLDGKNGATLLNALAERYIARYGSVEAAKKAMGDVGLEFGLASMAVMTDSNRFWKSGQFQTADYENCVKRLPLIPQSAEEAWAAAIQKMEPPRDDPLRGKVQLSIVAVLGAMMIQDRMFADGKFDEKASNLLLSRMRIIPLTYLKSQTAASGLDKYQVAITLANDNAHFPSERFSAAIRKAPASRAKPR